MGGGWREPVRQPICVFWIDQPRAVRRVRTQYEKQRRDSIQSPSALKGHRSSPHCVGILIVFGPKPDPRHDEDKGTKTSTMKLLLSFFLAAPCLLIADLVVVAAAETSTYEAGLSWLAEKRKQDGVLELPSGLLYTVRESGAGKFHPSEDTYCTVDYDISLKDGTQVESTRGGKPALMRPEDFIPALKEALTRMVDGDWWELYVPSHLGYGDRGTEDVQPGEALLVSLDLQTVLNGDKIPKGEVHDCIVQLDDDQAGGFFHVKSSDKCSERDVKYIQKIAGWGSRATRIREELARLRGVVKSGDMKEDLAFWLRRRIHLLKLFLKEDMRMCTVHFTKSNGKITIHHGEDCNYKELEYIEKVSDWDLDKVDHEIQRLAGMKIESMEVLLASWLKKRIRILNQISRARARELEEPEATESAKEETVEATENSASEIKEEL
jgi:hypothetical protein